MRASNHLIGFLNFSTFLLSIPILAGGIWLSNRANTSDCLKFLQWPIIIIGVSIMVVSLAGFAGACYRNTLLMYLYLWSMFLIIVALLGFIIFAYAVTDKGSGRAVLNRSYLEYHLEDYSGWLSDRVVDPGYWVSIRSCIRGSRICARMGRQIYGVPESPDLFYQRNLNPIQSGCCKPPTDCGFTYVNETVWSPGGGLVGTDGDCNIWSNEQRQLCYNCNSCKAGILASLKTSWRKASIINIVALIILVILYVFACAAFRHNRRMDNDEPSGETRMEKARPSRIHF
ncbi:tetraspanin-3-like [Impatiens glandulifera]|uniref:tetraspanin-3-like n=1 Tax=Impatiens glandulifera TaxID=253017 RepID=UPI001FB1161C|nr:tetraspanin-3-like [Impatiens glandulifera]